jgi:2-methylcitrate dehydratase PrpD
VELRDAVRELGRFVHELRWDDLSPQVRQRALDVLLDTIGVTVAGARTPELRALGSALVGDTGPARPLGTDRRLSIGSAAWLDGTAACTLELDEGNKRARGHPAAHVVPTALALAAGRPVTGDTWLAAFVAGHEVAYRFGAATRLHPGVHPHGNAAIAGAAAAAARLLGLDADATAGAIDAAGGLPLATDFAAATDGSFVRNTWIGQAAVSGIAAARLAAAGLADVDGRAGGTLGRILGELDVTALVADLGDELAVTTGYFKRHASCSYTHPPADAVLELRAGGVRASEVDRIEVHTHHLAAALTGREPMTRLAAMFSIPYVVAATLVLGRFDAEASGSDARQDPTIRRLAASTQVHRDPRHDARLPAERPARVMVHLTSGEVHTVEVPNPVGDADHHPLDRADVLRKLDQLLAPGEADAIAHCVDRLSTSPDAATILADLP